jgi:hypothetical protein
MNNSFKGNVLLMKQVAESETTRLVCNDLGVSFSGLVSMLGTTSNKEYDTDGKLFNRVLALRLFISELNHPLNISISYSSDHLRNALCNARLVFSDTDDEDIASMSIISAFTVSGGYRKHWDDMKKAVTDYIRESKEQESYRNSILSTDDIIKALDDLILRSQEKRKALLESKEAENAFVKRITNT